MKNNNSTIAPGFKYIILFFITLTLLIGTYIYWYFTLLKNSENHLIEFSKNLKNNEIEINWDEIITKGFPYRIEKHLKNVELKYKNIFIQTKNIKLINQPWNLKHFIIKIENEILIKNKINSLKIINDGLMSSIKIKNKSNIRLSIQSTSLKINSEKFLLHLFDPELHIRNINKNNIESVFIVKNIEFPLKKNEPLFENFNLHGSVLNYPNIQIKDIKNWFIQGGGIDLKNVSLLLNNNPILFNGFISLDKKFNILSTLSFRGTGLKNLLILLKNKNIITNEIFEASKMIINTINISSKLIDKEPTYTLNVQDGILSLMNVKILNVPNLEKYLFY